MWFVSILFLAKNSVYALKERCMPTSLPPDCPATFLGALSLPEGFWKGGLPS